MITVNTGAAFGERLVCKLKEAGLYTTDEYPVQDFSFELPQELAFVLTIYPKAFISHFPDWLKEEFAKRTKFPFKVSGNIGFSAVADNFLDGTKITYTIIGKVVMGEQDKCMIVK